jgi:hypothetical protein
MYAYYWRPHALKRFRRALTRAQITQHAAVLLTGAYVLHQLGWNPLHPITSFRYAIQYIVMLCTICHRAEFCVTEISS